MMLGAWGESSGSLGKTMLLSLLISFTLFTVAVAGHIHFWPICTTLFVSARFIFLDSFPALILGVILNFTVEAVFAVPVCVASGAGVETIAALRCPRVLFLRSALEFHVPSVLEGSNFVFVILSLRVAVLVDGCHGLGGLCSRFPLDVGRHLVHVVQRDCILIVLSNSFSQISW
jgi:hypothetical protein